MFDLLRRNYLYHVSLLVFEASNRIQGVAGQKVQEEFYQQVTGHPAMLFAKCFGEAFSINSLAAQEEFTKVKSVTKMRDESFDLTCPMYVCAFVATMLLQMWNDRLSSAVSEATVRNRWRRRFLSFVICRPTHSLGNLSLHSTEDDHRGGKGQAICRAGEAIGSQAALILEHEEAPQRAAELSRLSERRQRPRVP
mmetsp:Transcript_44640/g.71634  ORF Transcript_44640/g.71634 Transcript_44640/m.71634 type:complete len:195 (-) Transcript_44640:562-1146(-)